MILNCYDEYRLRKLRYYTPQRLVGNVQELKDYHLRRSDPGIEGGEKKKLKRTNILEDWDSNPEED